MASSKNRPFCYDALDPEIAALAREAANVLAGLNPKSRTDVIAIGRELAAIRPALPRHFHAWRTTYCRRISEGLCATAIKIFQRFGDPVWLPLVNETATARLCDMATQSDKSLQADLAAAIARQTARAATAISPEEQERRRAEAKTAYVAKKAAEREKKAAQPASPKLDALSRGPAASTRIDPAVADALLAIRRALAEQGREAAIAEINRRIPGRAIDVDHAIEWLSRMPAPSSPTGEKVGRPWRFHRAGASL